MISAVVVTHNSAPLLPDLFASLPAAMQGLEPWNVTIVDGASTDGTLEAASRLAPDARVLELGRNAGYAAGVILRRRVNFDSTPAFALRRIGINSQTSLARFAWDLARLRWRGE